MINDKYYVGFEGEVEIDLVRNDQDGNESTFRIWNGYFETILDHLLDHDVPKEGIVKEYFYQEGWYNQSPWHVKDISLTIKQFRIFDPNKVRSSSSLKEVLPELVIDMIDFLEQAKVKEEDVYIKYD
ncbi:hypothetical protein QUF88_17020 [Bacillus sp. DX1.1]|uniref:hypothetical protein n=1 Tax=unclassified Bacillus (in: firmicutes) TaxID=185979 RepID=UPI002570D0F7|nr:MULTISPECIES: hypothetical protein [unclassified Bacillus (in: firmicutes)]MDM5155445.1 hypothetical protein [Bacillus sp. DX1.1]WJE79758.1 hypothetical protein QRE67_14545 [Bacillus sp. DX3.1]